MYNYNAYLAPSDLSIVERRDIKKSLTVIYRHWKYRNTTHRGISAVSAETRYTHYTIRYDSVHLTCSKKVTESTKN